VQPFSASPDDVSAPLPDVMHFDPIQFPLPSQSLDFSACVNQPARFAGFFGNATRPIPNHISFPHREQVRTVTSDINSDIPPANEPSLKAAAVLQTLTFLIYPVFP